MAGTKVDSSRGTKKVTNDDALQAEVASFAASLGLGAGSGAGAGFDDSDFRKSGPLAPHQKKKKQDKQVQSPRGKAASRDSAEAQNGIQLGKKGGKQSVTDSKAGPGAAKDRKRASPFVEASEGQKKMAKTGPASNADKAARPVQENRQLESGKAAFRAPQFSSSPWYEQATAAAARVAWNGVSAQARGPPDGANPAEWETLVQGKRREGEQLLDKVASNYAKFQDKDSDRRWVSKAGKFGTSADKVAAMTVMVQDNPIANLRALDSLLGMVTSKGGKRHAVTGILALKELFLTNLLPDRKLKYLSQQPLSSLPMTKEGMNVLLFWCWEDSLKQRYEKFVAALEESTKDTLPILKEKAVKTVFELLKTKPEQERRLLAALVNKLGDPERRIASNASYMLSCLLSEHPNMKAVVVEEVDSFIFRPHVGLRAKYYATVFCNQIVLTKGEGAKLAKRLIDLYFALFKTLTAGDKKAAADSIQKKDSKKGTKDKGKLGTGAKQVVDDPAELDSRLLSALLTGINRAFPFVAADEVDAVVQSHSPLLFRLVHSENLNVGVQALILLHQLLSKNLAMSDRFYRALYDVLQSPGLFKSSKVEMFISLLFKAIKADINSKRVAAFIKRLMQVAMQQSPQYACGSLLIVSEVLKARPSLWNAILQPESNDEEDEHFVDVSDGTEDGAVMSTVEHSEGSGNKDTGAVDRDQDLEIPHEESEEIDSDAEEMKLVNYDDSDDDSYSTDDNPEDVTRKHPRAGGKKVSEQPEKHDDDNDETMSTERATSDGRKGKLKVETRSYNPRSREPSFCNADQACWWELSALAVHVHPSVAAMAKTLIAGANVVYSGDPLRDFALGVFLDRFAEKKPKVRKSKESGTWHGSSLSFPTRTMESASSLPIGEQFLSIAEADVAPEDVVFHKFYLAKDASRKKSQKKQKKSIQDDDDDDIVGLGDDVGVEGAGGDDSDNDEVEALLDLEEEGGDDDVVESEEGEDDGDSDGAYDYDKLEAAVAKDDGRDARAGTESGSDASEEEGWDLSDDGGGESQDVGAVSSDDEALGGEQVKVSTGKGAKGVSPFASAEQYSHLLSEVEADVGPHADDGRKPRRRRRISG